MWVIWRLREARVAAPGAARDGGRVWVPGWGVGRELQGHGQSGGLRGWVSHVLCRCTCPRAVRAPVIFCRPGGLEEKLAVFCGRGKDFADECAYLVHLLVGGGKRVL